MNTKQITRVTRHFNIAFKRATISANQNLFKKNGEPRKNAGKKLNWTNEMRQAHRNFCRAFNLALANGVNLERDIVIANTSYNV